MNNTKLISLILAVLLLFSLSASAMADTDVATGETRDYNGDTVTNNDGTVTNNYGTVTNNASNGTVTNNASTGNVTYNYGTVTNNDGTVDTNYGTVTTSGSGNNQATVSDNFGTVENNYGNISRNGGNSNNGNTSDNHGTVENNYGTIAYNYDTVKNNSGIVSQNWLTGTVINNAGTVESNYGSVTNVDNGSVSKNYGTVITSDNETWYGTLVWHMNGDGDDSLISGNQKNPIDLSTVVENNGYDLKGYTTIDIRQYEYSENDICSETTYAPTAPGTIWLIWVASDPDPVPQPGPAGGGSGSSGSSGGETYVVVMPQSLEPSAGGKGLSFNCSTYGSIPAEAELKDILIVKVDFKDVDESYYKAVLNSKGNIDIDFTDAFLATLPGGMHTASVIFNGMTYQTMLNIPYAG